MERSNLRKATFFLHLSILLFSFVAMAANRFDQVIVTNSQSVGTSAVPNSLAVLDLVSTTKGMLPPRMTTTQRNAIGSPPEALVVYDTTLHAPKYYNGSSWLDFGFQSPLTTLGDIMYENSTPAAARLAGNTTATKKYLSQTGTGSVSAAPAWLQPACGDLSDAVASCSTDATNASNISSGILAIARGGTNSSSVTTSPAVTAWAGWDANKNLSANNFLAGYSTTVTSGGTTVLTVSSAELQYYTGTTTHTVTLPVASTLVLGQSWTIVNQSTSAVTVQSSGGNTVQIVAGSAQATVTCILTSGTGTASWYAFYSGSGGGGVTSVAMTVPAFLSVSGSPITTSGTLAVTLSGTAIPIANGGTGQTSASAAFNALSPMTTGGDIIYGGASGAGTRLANGSSGTVLTSAGGTSAPTWTLANAGLLTNLAQAYSAVFSAADSIVGAFGKVWGDFLAERDPNEVKNCVIKTAVSTNNLTVSLRDAGGSSAPGAANPCVVAMQNSAGINNNKWVETLATASTSVTASSGSTLGCVSAVECWIFVYLQDDGSLCLSGTGTWDQGQLYTTVTIGAASTSQSTIYCSTGGAGHAVGLIGRIRLTEASAGVYASATTETYNGTYSTLVSKSAISTKNGFRDNQVLMTDSSNVNGFQGHHVLGPKNYITNPDFESNTTTGWGLGNVALTSNFPSGTPTFGSGFSGNLSILTQQSLAIEGLNSLDYKQVTTATVAGDFLSSNAFTIDTADQAKVLTFKFYYNIWSGSASVNFSGTSSNSFGVAIYNSSQGGANWIMPAGVWCFTQISGVGICAGTFQTTASDTQYRFVIYNANATSNPIQMLIDQVYVGPQTAPIGPVMTDAVAYTPTYSAGFGTVTNNQAWWSRHGDKMRLWGSATAGTVAGSVATVTLPSGYTVDTSKVPSTANANSYVGRFINSVTTASAVKDGDIVVAGNGTILQFSNDSYPNSLNAFNNQFGNALGATGAAFSWWAEVPITGWSSNVQMSSDTDTRVVAAIYTNNGGQALTGNTTDITYSTKVQDTHAAWSGTQFTVPVTGYYQVAAQVQFNATITNSIDVYKNGSQFIRLIQGYAASPQFGGSAMVFANAGDTLSLRSASSGTLLNTSGSIFHYININRVSGPSVIAATESVNARYTGSVSAITSSFADLTFTTKDYDSHAAMSGATYTVPVPGKYLINSQFLATAGTTAATNGVQIQILKNGSVVSGPHRAEYAGASSSMTTTITDIINANAGDTIKIQGLSGGTTPVITNTTTTANFVSISRVGN